MKFHFIFSFVSFNLIYFKLALGHGCTVYNDSKGKSTCYFPNLAFNTWSNTLRTCRALALDGAGNLAIVDSPKKLNIIVKKSGYFLGGEITLPFWIGLKYVQQRNQFYWVNGETLGSFNEFNREEYVDAYRTCVAMQIYQTNSTGFQGKWTIQNCDAALPSICQIITEETDDQNTDNDSDDDDRGDSWESYFEQQPKGHSCTGGVDIFAFPVILFLFFEALYSYTNGQHQITSKQMIHMKKKWSFFCVFWSGIIRLALKR